MKSRSMGSMLVVLAVAAWLAAVALGTIRGTVTDASGAAVAGAQITVTNTQTGLARTVVSNATGYFEALDLQPGVYNIAIRKTGFQSYSQNQVTLAVGQAYTVAARLQVGEVTQTVEVKTNPVQVNTTNAQLGVVISGSQITELPLATRNWLQLQQSQPGVVSSSDRFGNNYSTNGNRTQANNYLIAGTDYNDSPLNTALAPPSPDAIGEFRMVSSVTDAEYGRSSGATIDASIKSGTNRWHGDAFEFFRDTGLNAADFFTHQVAPFHQNEFGGTLGGPVQHDRTFFFFSYQGFRQTTGSARNTAVFTPAERNGDFSAVLLGALGDLSKRVSPVPLFGDAKSPCPGGGGGPCAAGTAYKRLFSTGVIPTGDFDPLAVKLLNAFVPLPNSATDPNAYLFSSANVNDDDQFIWRVDHNFGADDDLWTTGQWERDPGTSSLPFTGADLPGFAEIDARHTQHYSLAETHSFSPNVLNDVRIGYNRFNFNAVNPVKPVLPASFGFTGITPQNTAGAALPVISLTSYFTLGFSNNGPQPRIDDTGEVADNFSIIAGNHAMKFGADIRRAHVYNPFSSRNDGSYTFRGTGTFSTGDPGVDFLLGIPDAYNQGSGNVINARYWESYLYAQDQWQVSPELTLTFGTGWQLDTPLHNAYNGGLQVTAYRAGAQSTVFTGPGVPPGLLWPGDAGVALNGYNAVYHDFGPRFAFAYGPRTGWSLRGGMALLYNAVEEETTLQTLNTIPFGISSNGAASTVPGASPQFADPFQGWTLTKGTVSEVSGTNPFPAPPVRPGSAINWINYLPNSPRVFDPNFTTPYAENFNLTSEHQLDATTLISLGWVASFGRHLEGILELNPMNPAACFANGKPVVGPAGTPVAGKTCNVNINYLFPGAGTYANAAIYPGMGQESTIYNSNYNSLQATMKKAMSHGLSLFAAYTWAHGLDDGSSFENSWGGVNPNCLACAYGDSTYDARQRLVINYQYLLPAWHGGALGVLTNGWEMDGITTFQSGFPITVTESDGNSLECGRGGASFGCWDRPNLVGPLTVFTDPRTSPNGDWFNPSAFGKEALGQFGDAGRNFFHGPGFQDWDYSLIKNTRLAEDKDLQLRFEFFNVFNHANFANPNGSINNSRFGRITSTQGNARLVQLAAKIIF